jgi:hypothetical protein
LVPAATVLAIQRKVKIRISIKLEALQLSLSESPSARDFCIRREPALASPLFLVALELDIHSMHLQEGRG